MEEDNTTIADAIANIAYTSAALEKFCNHPKNYNSYGASLLEQMSRQLQGQARDLEQFQSNWGF